MSKRNDGNESEDDQFCPSHKDESGFVKTFPQRLFELLESVEDDSSSLSIKWSPSGDAFMIVDQAAFVDQLLPKFFKRTKFTSFKGKLYRWGFRRVSKGANAGSYFHKLFLKDNPTLCLHMRRQMKGKNAAAKDTIKPEEGVTTTSNVSSTFTSKQNKNVKKLKSKSINKKNKGMSSPSSLPKTPTCLNENKSNVFPPLPYSTVSQLSGHLSNTGLSKANIPDSAFFSSKESSQALLNTQAFTNVLCSSPQDQVTRALIEEGEGIENDEYTNNCSLQSRYCRNQNTDAAMTQIANRLSNSRLNEGLQDDVFQNTCLQSNVNAAFPQPSTGLLALHKNMYKGLMMMPSTNARISKWNTSAQRKKYQLSAKQALHNRVFSKNRRFNNRLPMYQHQYLEQDLQNRQGSPSEWGLGDNAQSSDNSKLDLLSNAALSFRTPFLQEYRTMDEPMQDSDEEPVKVVNGKLEIGRSNPRPESTYTFKGQMV